MFILKDGLEGLENLRSLSLAGNHIDSYDEFYKLSNLDNLRQLTLVSSKLNGTNPICERSVRDYKAEISGRLPQLELIDGESFKQNSPSLFKSLDDTLRQSIHEASFVKRDFDVEQCAERWLPDSATEQAESNRSRVSPDQDRQKFYRNFNGQLFDSIICKVFDIFSLNL